MRHKPRLDATQPDIVAALLKCGCTVQSLASIGGGCPDLLVGTAGEWYVLECKDGSLPPSKRALSEDERKWINKARAPVHIVGSVDEALRAVGAIR